MLIVSFTNGTSLVTLFKVILASGLRSMQFSPLLMNSELLIVISLSVLIDLPSVALFSVNLLLFIFVSPSLCIAPPYVALLLSNAQSLISQLLALTISIAPPLPITLLFLNVEPIIFPLVALSQYMAPPSSFAVLLSNIEFVMVTLVALFWYIAPPFGAVLFMNVHFSMFPLPFLSHPNAPALSVAVLLVNLQLITFPFSPFMHVAPL